MRILAVQLNPIVADVEGNTRKVLDALKRASEKKADIVIFPELTLCGYFPDDLLLEPALIEACARKLEGIAPLTRGMFVVVGLPRVNKSGKEKPLYNSAAVFQDGKLLGFQDKRLLPTYDVFDEARFFEPGEKTHIWEHKSQKIGVTICEDIWQHSHKLNGYVDYRVDPIMDLKGCNLVLNISASPYSFQKKNTRVAVAQAIVKTLKCPFVLCNQVGANDQIVFDGHSLFVDEKGVQMAKGFVEEDFWVGEKSVVKDDLIGDLYSALVLGVRDYFHKQGLQKALVGLSGGIDSALVACIAKEALGASNVLALTMPSRFSSRGSVEDSKLLAKKLGIEIQEIPIDGVFQAYLDLLEPYFQGKPKDETEENLQSRIRGMILMAFSNKFGCILLNTGNKSEMAMGYCTLYGDMAGGLGVLHDVTKLRIYELAKHIRIIPESIIKKAPSAELRENQTDADTLPPYEVLDPILEDYLEKRLPLEEIAKRRNAPLKLVQEIVRTIHLNEYKRRQAPISLRVTEKAFSKGRVIPIVEKESQD